MVVFPNCKINVGLNILRKREDGYHDLDTIFYPIPITDVLEILPSSNQNDPVEFSMSGIQMDANKEDNLCIKAYWLLKKDFAHLPPIKMHLHKSIPMGAGLGGGSADAAFTLRLLNDKFNLGCSTKQLIEYAAALGSDCPFFILNTAAAATGRGEQLTSTNLNLKGYQLILVNPGIHISTKEAFAQLKPCIPGKSINEIIQQPIHCWPNELKNDFESSIFVSHPAIAWIKSSFYQQGALFASMSGSGSTVYGIFPKDAPAFLLPTETYDTTGYWIKTITL